MELSDPKSTERFSTRVENYVRYRPSYPAEALNILHDEIGLTTEWTIADIGSGTGISAEMFLKNGNAVIGIEPNQPMRAAAERLLAAYPNFNSVNGTAEATTLPAQSVDCIVAAQAFHWFDAPRAREECRRILRTNGWAVLLWNTRRTDATPFLREYEQLVLTYGADFQEVRHERVDAARLTAFFGPGGYSQHDLANRQDVDLEALRGRLLSSSYLPSAGQSGHEEMLRAIDQLFARHHEQGKVCIEYVTQLYFGRLTEHPHARQL